MLRKSLILIFALLYLGDINSYAQDDLVSEDGITRTLESCSESTLCFVSGSILFAPMFPWLLYPMDDSSSVPNLRRFNRLSGDIDALLSKANDKYSGYEIDISFYKKWFGVELAYDTYNNGEMDDTFWSSDMVIRLLPRKHFQPRLTLGWQKIITDNRAGSGFRFSFFNYEIYFTKKFGVRLINHIGWIDGETIISGDAGFEYYVYPTISLKALMTIKHFYSELLYGFQTGLSIKL